jgi:hypothetical protein
VPATAVRVRYQAKARSARSGRHDRVPSRGAGLNGRSRVVTPQSGSRSPPTTAGMSTQACALVCRRIDRGPAMETSRPWRCRGLTVAGGALLDLGARDHSAGALSPPPGRHRSATTIGRPAAPVRTPSPKTSPRRMVDKLRLVEERGRPITVARAHPGRHSLPEPPSATRCSPGASSLRIAVDRCAFRHSPPPAVISFSARRDCPRHTGPHPKRLREAAKRSAADLFVN